MCIKTVMLKNGKEKMKACSKSECKKVAAVEQKMCTETKHVIEVPI